MAIESQHLSKYLSKDDPYIHSKSGEVYSAINNIKRTDKNGKEISQIAFSIQKLETIRDQLKDAAARFLGFNDSSVFDTPNNPVVKEAILSLLAGNGGNNISKKDMAKCIKIAIKTISSTSTIGSGKASFYDEVFKRLIPPLDEDILNSLGISTKVLNGEISIDGQSLISVDKLAEKIAEDLLKRSGGKVGKNNNSKSGGLLRGAGDLQKQIQKDIDEETSRSLTSKKGILKRIVKKNILEKLKNKGLKQDFAQAYMEVFRNDFPKNNTGDVTVSKIVEQRYLDYVEDRLKNKFPNVKTIGSLANAMGAGGEELFSALTGLEIQIGKTSPQSIITTGTMTDQELSQILGANNIFGGNTESLKKDEGEGITDLVLINERNEKARVQSKNYATVMNSWLDKKGGGFFSIGMMKKDGDYSLTELYQMQEKLKTGGMGYEVLDQRSQELLSYVIANDAWFQNAGSLIGANVIKSGTSTKKDKKKNPKYKKAKKSTANHAALISILTDVLINYLGIMVSQTSPDTISADNSNLFYLIDNAALVPSFEVVNALIQKFREAEESIMGIRVSLNKGNFSYENPGAEGLYKNKQEAAPGNHLDQERRAQDAGVIEAGKEVGAGIISGGVGIHSMNLNFNLNVLLTSSYNFTSLLK